MTTVWFVYVNFFVLFGVSFVKQPMKTENYEVVKISFE
jgi:hypothetical protein